MQNITFDGYHLPTLVRLAKELGSPTNDGLAEVIWRLSNRNTMPLKVACDFMSEAGYLPFMGFPLMRETAEITETGRKV